MCSLFLVSPMVSKRWIFQCFLGLLLHVLLLLSVARPQAPVDESVAEVFDALDLSRPELSAVAAAWSHKDLAVAVPAMADYLRVRKNVCWIETVDGKPKLINYSKADAEAAVRGRVRGGTSPLYYNFPDGNINWLFNATEHVPGHAPDLEWQWQLNRMGFWNDLAGAYQATGDERYAAAFVMQLRSWIDQCPLPMQAAGGANNPAAFGSPWRTLEAGIRMEISWPNCFFLFLHSHSFEEADLVAMLRSILQHGRYLARFHGTMNWWITESAGLYDTGALFPEFHEAASWRAQAVRTLTEQIAFQYFPDGGQRELSTGYHSVTLAGISRAYRVAQRNGLEKEFPPDFLKPMEKAYAWNLRLMTPDRSMPKFNDSGWGSALDALKEALDFFPARDDFRWIVTGGKEGAPPGDISCYLPFSGYAAMRSGWDREANYLAFRVGPIGVGHIHQDKLDVQLWPYGREVLWGSGGGQYEKSKWRDWSVSSFAANTVIIDGLGQNRPHDPAEGGWKEVDADWQSTPVFDFATGIYDEGYGPKRDHPAVHRRDVLFLKPDLFVVADRLVPNDATPHTYQARWNLATPATRTDPATRAVVTVDAGKPNLAVVPLLGEGLDVKAVSAQETPEILGWIVQRGESPRVPATTVVHVRAGVGQQIFLTLLVPLAKGVGNPVIKVEPVPGRAEAAEVTLGDGRCLRIACLGERGITVAETLFNGQPGRTAQGGG